MSEVQGAACFVDETAIDIAQHGVEGALVVLVGGHGFGIGEGEGQALERAEEAGL